MNHTVQLRRAAIAAVFILGTVLTALLVLRQELSWRSERARLTEEIHAAQAASRDAEGRQERRAAQLKKALAEVEQRKREINSPQEVVRALPQELPLPVPIHLSDKNPTVLGKPPEGSSPAGNGPAELPVADLKPLYDFALNCRVCQQRLSASEANLADERQKRLAKERELAAETKLARGGGFWRRAKHAAKWFLLGAAAGAIAASAHR